MGHPWVTRDLTMLAPDPWITRAFGTLQAIGRQWVVHRLPVNGPSVTRELSVGHSWTRPTTKVALYGQTPSG